MKYLLPASLFLVLSGIFFACSGTVEKEEEPTASDLCAETCEKSETCYASGSSGYYGDDYVQECRQSCRQASREAERSDCESEFYKLLECTNEEFSCDTYYGSGDYPCERRIENYIDCMYDSY